MQGDFINGHGFGNKVYQRMKVKLGVAFKQQSVIMLHNIPVQRASVTVNMKASVSTKVYESEYEYQREKECTRVCEASTS